MRRLPFWATQAYIVVLSANTLLKVSKNEIARREITRRSNFLDERLIVTWVTNVSYDIVIFLSTVRNASMCYTNVKLKAFIPELNSPEELKEEIRKENRTFRDCP